MSALDVSLVELYAGPYDGLEITLPMSQNEMLLPVLNGDPLPFDELLSFPVQARIEYLRYCMLGYRSRTPDTEHRVFMLWRAP